MNASKHAKQLRKNSGTSESDDLKYFYIVLEKLSSFLFKPSTTHSRGLMPLVMAHTWKRIAHASRMITQFYCTRTLSLAKKGSLELILVITAYESLGRNPL